jgi:hypothetical protein
MAWRLALALVCGLALAEPSLADDNRWEAYLTDDEPAELAFYCPDCATREFD